MKTQSVMKMLNGVSHWIDIQYDNNKTTQKSEEFSDDYENYDEESDLIVVWETGVQPLTDVQRLIFLAMTIIVTIVAICGNILVLYVNFSRFVAKPS